MFWIFMYMTLFGNSLVPELTLVPQEKAIIQTIADEVRLQAIMAIRDEMATQEEALSAFMQEQYAELSTLSKDHDPDYDKFKSVLERIDQGRNTFQQSLIDKRFRLKELMGREEWQAVYKKK